MGLPRVLFLDACVLYPAQTRDIFMELAVEGMVRLKWSARVQEEWLGRLLENRPHLSEEQKARLLQTPGRMAEALADYEPLVQGYEFLLEQVSLPDPHDAHVVAAAFYGGAEAILTFNLADFPEETLERFDLSAWHPDEYLVELAESLIRHNALPEPLLSALKRIRERLKNPPLDPEGYIQALERAGLGRFSALLRSFRPHL